MISARNAVFFALLALLSLTGSQCVFIAWSGSDPTDKDKEEEEQPGAGLVVVVGDGRLVDAPVEGVHFVSGSLAGVTGPAGEFQYQQGELVRFYIGDIALGEAVAGKPIVTPLDLVPGGTLDTPAVINIARLLQSLDAVPGDERITITAQMRQAASRSSAVLYAALESLDYADEAAFVNAASQLVATLTADYPFTATLVDADSARRHLAAVLERQAVTAFPHNTP